MVKIKNLKIEQKREKITFVSVFEGDEKFSGYENTCKISFSVIFDNGEIIDYKTDCFGRGLWQYFKKEGFRQIKGTCDVNFCCKTRSGIYKKIRRYFERY